MFGATGSHPPVKQTFDRKSQAETSTSHYLTLRALGIEYLSAPVTAGVSSISRKSVASDHGFECLPGHFYVQPDV